MIKIGQVQNLEIDSFEKHGVFLKTESNDRVLMLGSEITPEMKEGDRIDVFVYCDSKGRPIATLQMPVMQFGEIDYLKVVASNDFGAFVDWGLPKDLFIPHKNQKSKMDVGQNHFVSAYFDDFSERIVGTSRVDFILKNEIIEFEEGQRVGVLVYELMDIGYKCIISKKYAGLLYKNEVFRPLNVGDRLDAYVKKIRENNKIDLALWVQDFSAVEQYVDDLYAKLKEMGGIVPFNDKSTPDEIYNAFGVSKKMFKKACGILYKKKLIVLSENGITVS